MIACVVVVTPELNDIKNTKADQWPKAEATSPTLTHWGRWIVGLLLFSLPRLKIARGSAVGHPRHKLERDDVSDDLFICAEKNGRGGWLVGDRKCDRTLYCTLHVCIKVSRNKKNVEPQHAK
jgi:hypothetical protein